MSNPHNRLLQESRAATLRAQAEASGLGSTTVEAEHLLLALVQSPDPEIKKVLEPFGMGRDWLLEALAAERQRSLSLVGVSLDDFPLPDPAPTALVPKWATSAKRALARAQKISMDHGDRRISPLHLLLGVIDPSRGMVPRTLTSSGIDLDALRARGQAESLGDVPAVGQAADDS